MVEAYRKWGASYRTCLRPTFRFHDVERDAWKNIRREIGACGSQHHRLALQGKRRFRFFFIIIASGNSDKHAIFFSHTFFQRRLKWQRLCGAAPIDDVHILVFMRHSHIAEESLSLFRPVMNHAVLADHRVGWRVRERECERRRTRIILMFFAIIISYAYRRNRAAATTLGRSLCRPSVKWERRLHAWASLRRRFLPLRQ